MDRSSWMPLALFLAAAGCAEDAVPSMDVEQVSMTSEYRRPEPAAHPASELSQESSATTPILPEIAADSTPDQVAVALPVSPPGASASATPASAAPADEPAEPSAFAPRPLKVLVPEKTLPKISGGDLRLSFDDIDLLKVLDAETVPVDVVDHFPSWLRELNGKNVRLKGWMPPPSREKELAGFMFVRDSKDCCFGANVKIYDQIAVKMKPGTTADYIHMRPFDVGGRFVIKPIVRDGKLKLLYFIEDATVFEKS